MHFALNCLIRLTIAAFFGFIGWHFFTLPVVVASSFAQAVFFVSFAASQPNWRSLLGESYLEKALSKIPEEDRKPKCGGDGVRPTCAPSLAEGHRKAVEIDFCMRRVESRVVRLENEMWKKTLFLGAASFSPLLYSKMQLGGAVTTSTAQLLELGTPMTLLFFTICVAYAEISTQRDINLSAAGL